MLFINTQFLYCWFRLNACAFIAQPFVIVADTGAVVVVVVVVADDLIHLLCFVVWSCSAARLY